LYLVQCYMKHSKDMLHVTQDGFHTIERRSNFCSRVQALSEWQLQLNLDNMRHRFTWVEATRTGRQPDARKDAGDRLPRCARNDAGVGCRASLARTEFVTASVARQSRARIRSPSPTRISPSYNKPGYKSAHAGFIPSIKFTFLARDPALSCFSRAMASSIVACISK